MSVNAISESLSFLAESPSLRLPGSMVYRRAEPSVLGTVVERAFAQIKEIAEMSGAESERTFEARYRLYETVCELQLYVNELSERSVREGDFRKEVEQALQTSLEHVSPLVFATQRAFQKRLALLKSQHHIVLEEIHCLRTIIPPAKVPAFGELLRTGEGLDLYPSLYDPQKSYQHLARVEQVLSIFRERVDSFKRALCLDLQVLLGFSREEVDQILQGAFTNWRSMIEEKDNGRILQKHSIRRLKIYKLPGANELIVDIGMNEVAFGACKRVKETHRLGGRILVRLTPIQHDTSAQQVPQEERDEIFTREMHHEVRAHQMLAGVSHIAGISCVQYYNKKGMLKTRYLMAKYEGDLWGLVVKSQSELNSQRALIYYRDILDCVKQMHEKGFVHGDLKLSNVLFWGRFGFLCDFGLTYRFGEKILFTGTPEYMAPELLVGDTFFADPKTDIFSLGIMLFGITHPHRHDVWLREVRRLQTEVQNKHRAPNSQCKQLFEHVDAVQIDPLDCKTTDSVPKKMSSEAWGQEILRQYDALNVEYLTQYRSLLSTLAAELTHARTPFDSLSSRLISYIPSQRPDIIQTEKEFSDLLISLGGIR